MFFRLHTDHTQTPAGLADAYAGPVPSACWLIGGGPSLAQLPCDAIARSPIPKMALNLAGTKLLRPTFWTSYDPSVRFHRSIYLDPGILKFVHRRRAMDLVPETSFKVCDCPATFFFERDQNRGFADFLSSKHAGIVDWADTMVQAIDILYRLGFRTLYLAGCEMRVRPSAAQIEFAAARGVPRDPQGRMDEWLKSCRAAGIAHAELDELDSAATYHFDETKPVAAAANTDFHYFRIAQYLRLSRRAMALAGMQLVSVTPGSRLNDVFPHQTADDVLEQIHRNIGDPAAEPVRGLYRQSEGRTPEGLGPMRDYRPHNWPARKPIPAPAREQPARSNAELLIEAEGFVPTSAPATSPAVERLRHELDQLPPDLPAPNEHG